MSVRNELLDSFKALEQENARLREALEVTVWRDRAQFPDDPYCVLRGAGKKWANKHGHQPDCALSRGKP